MKNKIILATIIFLFSFVSFVNGQENDYANEIAKIERKQYKFDITSGILYFPNDSLEANVLLFRKRNRMYNHLFCVVKSKGDSLLYYTAKDIMGYRINNDYYYSHKQGLDYYFIKKNIEGKVNLYERSGIPSDYRFLYYIKFATSPNLYVICPYDNKITQHNISGKD